MTKYLSFTAIPSPFSEEVADLICDSLGQAGFESFDILDDRVTAYLTIFPATDCVVIENEARLALEDIMYPLDTLSIAVETVEGKDWNEEWEKNYFQPIMIGNRCVIHSTFHTDIPHADIDIVIDPKMAFGTGHHSTTNLIVSRLLDLDLKGKSVIDMGTGTGILSIVCAKMGASPVVGIEIDPGAWENAVENVALNKVDAEMICGDVSSLDEIQPCDLFLANINRNIILADIAEYGKKLKSGGTILLSGFYLDDVPLIETAAAESLLRLVHTYTDQNWTCMELVKTGCR